MYRNAVQERLHMDYKIIRVTLDIAVPYYGGKYEPSGMDYIDVHSDAQSLGFTEQQMELTAKATNG